MSLVQLIDTEIIVDQIQVGNVDGSSLIDLPTVFVKAGLPVTTELFQASHSVIS